MRAAILPAGHPEPRLDDDGRIRPGRRVVHRDGRRFFVTDDGAIPVPANSPTTRPSLPGTGPVVTTREAD